MKGGKCNSASAASWLLSKFLGAYLLLAGLRMLLGYNATVEWLMTMGQGLELGSLNAIAGVVTMIVAYTWPIVKPLIGLSFLACYKKCWATMVLMVYLFTFFLGHMWMENMTGATFDLVFVGLVMMMMIGCGMGQMCEKK